MMKMWWLQTAVEDLKTRLLEAMEQRVKKLEEDRERVLKQRKSRDHL